MHSPDPDREGDSILRPQHWRHHPQRRHHGSRLEVGRSSTHLGPLLQRRTKGLHRPSVRLNNGTLVHRHRRNSKNTLYLPEPGTASWNPTPETSGSKAQRAVVPARTVPGQTFPSHTIQRHLGDDDTKDLSEYIDYPEYHYDTLQSSQTLSSSVSALSSRQLLSDIPDEGTHLLRHSRSRESQRPSTPALLNPFTRPRSRDSESADNARTPVSEGQITRSSSRGLLHAADGDEVLRSASRKKNRKRKKDKNR